MKKQILILAFLLPALPQASHAMEISKKTLSDTAQTELNEQLCVAMHNEDLYEIERLLKSGANPNTKIHTHNWLDEPDSKVIHKNRLVNTLALQWAMQYHLNIPICKLLLQYGANPNYDNLPALFSVQYDTHSYRAFDMYNLLFEYGENINQTSDFDDISYVGEGRAFEALTPLDWAARWFHKNHCDALIICANFNPKLDRGYVTSKQRILTALWIFKLFRVSSDIRKKILRDDSELKEDLERISAYGKLSAICEENAHTIPFQLVRLLIGNGQLDPDKTVAILKQNHISCIKPLMTRASLSLDRILLERGLQENERKWREERIPMRKKILDPEKVEEHYGDAIEKNIRRRLGLITWYEKAYDMLPNNPCVIQ